jgi:hypothetical protein
MDNIIPFPFERMSGKHPTGPRWREPAPVALLPVVRNRALDCRRQLEPAAVKNRSGSEATPTYSAGRPSRTPSEREEIR